VRDRYTIEWMAGGFCRVSKVEGKFYYKIDEPIIIRCVLQYLLEQKVSLCNYFMDKICQADNASSAGIQMDNLVAFCFLDLQTNKISVLESLPGVGPILFDSIVRLANSNTQSKSLLDLLKCRTPTYILPKHYAGPDGILLCGNVLYVIAIKTTQREKRSVDRDEVVSNFATTDLMNLFPGVSKEAEKIAVWDYLCRQEILAVVRIHIVLPCASNEATCFQAGFRLSCKSQTYTPNPDSISPAVKRKRSNNYTLSAPQYILDIDNTNIRTCGLCPERVSTKLCEIYSFVRKK